MQLNFEEVDTGRGVPARNDRPQTTTRRDAPTSAMGERLSGTVRHVIMFSEESGYAVLSVDCGKTMLDLKCVGNVVERPAEGIEYEFVGEWTIHPKFGKQFKFTTAEQFVPSDSAGLVRYLESGSISGVGPSLARAIVAHFGEDTVSVLDQCDEKLLMQVSGIGRVKAAGIAEQWAEKVKYRELSIKLMALGISPNLCVKVIKHFEKLGQDAWAGIMDDPYCLTALWGVGFKTADRIGHRVGIGDRDPRRLRAACLYALQLARDNDGHCYLLEETLANKVSSEDVAGVDVRMVAEFLSRVDADLTYVRMVEVETGDRGEEDFAGRRHWLARLHRDEVVLAERHGHLAQEHVAPRSLLREDELQDAFCAKAGYYLTDEQLEAVYALMHSPLGVLTGGPGVGKTATTRALVILAEASGMKVGLASPTGRAAKRLEEMTGHEAKTLHRMLMWSQSSQSFQAGPEDPLPYDLVIVDEASMVDVSLARALAEAIDEQKTRLIYVGDKDQLPSVGPGYVLNDVIASGVAQVRELTQIMRQAEGSGIVSDAHLVNHGKQPLLATGDAQFVDAADSEWAKRVILALAQKAQSEETELQVLSPMRVGPLGTVELNRVLQAALNPPAEGKAQLVLGKDKSRIFRVGDRVIQLVNDYDREVMNGDVGVCVSVDTKERELTVRFADKVATYAVKDLNNVDLAFAMTIHKSQGSEMSDVVVVVSWGHYIMLERQLLYTAMTRAKERLTMVGEMRAIERCVSHNRAARRNTRLAERLSSH